MKDILRPRVLACAAIALWLTACAEQPAREPAAAEPAPPPLATRMAEAIADARGTLPQLNSSARVTAAVNDYYDAHANAPGWFNVQGAPKPAVKALLDALARADRQGLVTADYATERIAQRVSALGAAAQTDRVDAGRVAGIDVLLSSAFVSYAIDLHRGRIDDPDLKPRWYADLPAADYAGALERAAATGNVDQALSALTPPHGGYTRLVKALADYRTIADAGGWPQLPDGPLLEPDMLDARVPVLRERLRITGDLAGSTVAEGLDEGNEALASLDGDRSDREESTPRYDAALVAGVKHFQRRHGLADDGRVGPATRAALNVPAAQRAQQIRLNLERWRWLPADLGERYIMVNIPEYRLRAIDHGRVALEMRVIVGKSYDNRATPVFSDRMRYVIFGPYWNIPHGIAVKEILPEARRDPDYLARRHYQIVRVFGPNAQVLPATPANLDKVERGALRMRQAPGPGNALGRVKFMFPNRYAVYLHDTPSNQLFARTERDFSHGCVRVEQPAALARFVLAGKPGWDARRIAQALDSGDRQLVNLPQPIPVYLIYWTAFVTEEGVQFRNDLYHHDSELEKAMQHGRTALNAPGNAI